MPLEGERRALTEQTGLYSNPSPSPDGSQVAFLGQDDPLTDPQNAMVGVLDLASGERRWVSSGLDRTFAPFPGAQPPDLGRRGAHRLLRGPRRPAPVPRGTRRQRPAAAGGGGRAGHHRLRRRRWHGGLHRLDDRAPAGAVRHRPRRPGAAADFADRALRHPRRHRSGRALQRPVDRRGRGRRLAPHPSRLRPVPALSGTAQRARRAVHPVRQPVLRRGADPGRGRLRRRDGQPARLVRAGRPPGVRPSWVPTTRRRRAGAGARSTSTTCWPRSTPRSPVARRPTPTGSGCSAAATAASWPPGWPAPRTASRPSAASGP